MENLIISYAKDADKINTITKARSTLIHYYFDTLKQANALAFKMNPDEIPEVYIPKDAIVTLNRLCNEAGLDPLFTGNMNNAFEVFAFAEALVKKIMDKMQEEK